MPIVVHASVPQAPATDAQTPDGRMRATVMPDSAGVFLRADYRDLFGQLGYEFHSPFRVTFWRKDANGVVSAVRGADDIPQYGGIVHAYDDEVKFGQQVTYWATAPLADNSDTVETGHVAVLTWEPDGGFSSPGVWIKNLENPDLSVPARCIEWSGGSWASRNATADIWGGSSPAIVTDVRKSYNTKMTILTADEEEYQALREAVNASVVYIVGLERHRRRTGYYLVGDIAPSRVGRPSSSYDAWDVVLTGMDRPSSSGHSLSVPGRSYADRRRAMETYRRVAEAPGHAGYLTRNLAFNPSMEAGLDNTLTYNSAARDLVTSDVHSGTNAIQLTGTGSTSYSGNQWLIEPVTAGQTITASAWVKVPGTGTTAFFSFRFATSTIDVASAGVPTAGEWSRVNATYTVPPGQTIDRIAIAYNSSPGTVWLADDFMAEYGSEVHDFGHGGSGGGWSWTGEPHASSSTYGRTYAMGTEPY